MDFELEEGDTFDERAAGHVITPSRGVWETTQPGVHVYLILSTTLDMQEHLHALLVFEWTLGGP